MQGYPGGYLQAPSHGHISRSEQFYRSRGNGAPGVPPTGPPQFPGHPGMDPNYHYYQQHGMMPPHPGYQHMNAFSPGQYPGHQRPPGAPGAPPPGAQAMRAPMPQHMQEMDEHQRQWYAQQHAQQQAAAHHHAQQAAAAQAAQAHAAQAQQASTPAPSTTPAPQTAPTPQAAQASGSNTQPATPSASNQPPTPASASASSSLQVEPTTATSSGSQAGSRAPSVGPGTSATPETSSLPAAGSEAQATTSTETSAPVEPGTSTPSDAPSVSSVPPPPPGQLPQNQQAPPGPPGHPQHPGPYPGYQGYPPGAMRPPAGFAPPPGAPYGYPPGGPPPTGYHISHPQHPQHAQYVAWQHQRYQQQQQQQGMQGAQRPPYPYPGGSVPPNQPTNRMPPPPTQGAASPSGASGTSGKPTRYGTPAPPSRATAPTPQPLAATIPIVPPSTSSQPTPTTGSYLANTLANTGPAQPSTSAVQPAQHVISQQQQHQYPPGCIEATATSQAQVKRRKVYARELINATPRRLIMSLRSGLEAEAIWAINALNVLLYDDTNPQPSLQQMPGLVNVIVEHLYATLSILFPSEFQLTEPGKPIILDDSQEIVDKLLNTESSQEMKAIVEKMPVVPRKGSDKTATFTMMSRNGLQVHFRDESIPIALRKRITRENTEIEASTLIDQTISSKYVTKRNSVGLGGGLAERIATRLRDKLVHEKTRPRPVFSKYMRINTEENATNSEVGIVEIKKEENQEDNNYVLLMRGARPDELSDCKHEVELAWPRPTALSPKSRALEELSHRALALSNILRGFSFVPGSDALMARNEALLFIIGRFMRLNVVERKISSKRPGVVLDVEELKKEPKPMTAEEKEAKEKSVLDEVDATTAQMVETANQLRDDAFVMLTHMSVSLNLFELPDAIAYPIYDGLLRWAVSRVPEATDSTIPAPVSPRDYSLEIMCKMVVIERNVDMLLSTGSWSRVEQLVHILSRLLTMNEETHYREFAIVILNAMCIASEAVCYICSMETSTIAHLILFIDSADQSMHQVMQAHGMAALRDNPELMGTSVGMLRRAASMLRLLVKVPKAYKIYMKHQTRLLQFTMSQLMDSRVAGMVADTLFEIQEYVKEFGEDVPEPLKITYSEGYQPDLEGEKEPSASPTEMEETKNAEITESSKQEKDSASGVLPPNVQGNGTTDCESDRPSSSEAVITSFENNHKNEEEEELKKDIDEGESCDGYESETLRLSQKRSAAALIDEQSRSPPPKRSCLTNGFDKSKSSVSTNGTLGDAGQNDGALTTAVA
uniref:BAF250_C domain-containing protein n=1 Tax=Caenorhabditis tropicalis TaxID=1561998 RepID=A0A1I7UY54_9PELO